MKRGMRGSSTSHKKNRFVNTQGLMREDMRDADIKRKVAISLAIPCFFQRLTKLITIFYTNCYIL